MNSTGSNVSSRNPLGTLDVINRFLAISIINAMSAPHSDVSYMREKLYKALHGADRGNTVTVHETRWKTRQ